MKKIPTLFEREFSNHKVVGITDKVTETMEWKRTIVRPQRITHVEGEIEMQFEMVEDIGGELYRLEALEEGEAE